MSDDPARRPASRPGRMPPTAPADARRVLDVWVRLIRDEAVYRAFAAGRHREEAAALRLDAEELAILDQFEARPGTRWNIENIRFRATDHVAVRLRMWLPLTVHALTGGNEDWLNDLVFEYLTHHGWSDLGPYQLSECERFVQFVRERVTLRRRWNPHLDPILTFELAVVQLLKSTRDIPSDAWRPPPAALSDDALAALRPRPGPAVRIVELPIDVTPWLRTENPTGIPLGDEPTQYLVYVPSLQQPHKVQTIGEGARLVFEACDGERTTAAVAAALEAEHEIEPAGVHALVRRWIEAGALHA